MTHRRTKIFVTAFTLLILAALCIACYPIVKTALVMGYEGYQDVARWKDHTSPLEPEVAKDICEKLNLTAEDPRCQDGATVYGPNFFRTIGETLQPQNGKALTYDEVEEMLGEYRFREESMSINTDGKEYFGVWYDLKGDRVYPIVIFYYKDKTIWKILADVTD